MKQPLVARHLAAVAVAGMVAVLCASAVGAQAAPSESGPAWSTLTSSQKQALAPLQREWPLIEGASKQKWLELSGRYAAMPVDERQRVQDRMAAWARMSPAERADARQQFQEARQLPPQERQARWQAYQALSEEEKRQLALRARPAPPVTPATVRGPAARTDATTRTDDKGGKRNVVTASPSPTSRVVAPSVVQATPGATTTTMSIRPSPPSHHQTGLPKIAATPGFVDPETLLPQRGPQGAAVRAGAPASAAQQR